MRDATRNNQPSKHPQGAVIELGCGTAVPSLEAARAHALPVCLCDRRLAPAVLDAARQAVKEAHLEERAEVRRK